MHVGPCRYYYQAEVLGQAVTWLVPHPLSQVLPTDVDYRVMLTFLEFYATLIQVRRGVAGGAAHVGGRGRAAETMGRCTF